MLGKPSNKKTQSSRFTRMPRKDQRTCVAMDATLRQVTQNPRLLWEISLALPQVCHTSQTFHPDVIPPIYDQESWYHISEPHSQSLLDSSLQTRTGLSLGG